MTTQIFQETINRFKATDYEHNHDKADYEILDYEPMPFCPRLPASGRWIVVYDEKEYAYVSQYFIEFCPGRMFVDADRLP